MSNTHQAVALYPNVKREFFYLRNQDGALACWQHSPIADNIHSQAIILCAPFGHEYTHSHRSFKHLAESLASQGFTVFRFDYQGTGDSSGSDIDENRVQTWIENICSVAEHVQISFAEITLIGFRLGASLAALATQKIDVSQLVLWEPIIKGKTYVRELTAIARLAQSPVHKNSDWIECAGFLMTTNTQKEISAIDLTNQPISTKKAVLLLGRDDRQYDPSLRNLLTFTHNNISEAYLPGYVEMLDEPHATKVPFTAFAFISQWLIKQPIEMLSSHNAENYLAINKSTTLNFEYNGLILEEQSCWYHQQNHLFGICTYLKDGYDARLPAIILLNSGSVHHVGPNRIYIDIARTLASLGFYVMRLDLEGLGDSASAIPAFKNHPYQPNAIANVYSAMEYFKNCGIANTFILGGICSGAHSAFHTAIADLDRKSNILNGIFLINPLTFYWREGMSLEIPQQDLQTLMDKGYYKKSIHDINKWKKLLSGKTSLRGIFQFITKLICLKSSIYLHNFKDVIFRNETQLSIDFNRLSRQKTRVYFIFSGTDPGLDIIKQHAYKSFKRGEKNGNFNLAIIEHADHTFSKKAMREKLLLHMKLIFNRVKQESSPL